MGYTLEFIVCQELEIKSISFPKKLSVETQRLIPKVDYTRLATFLLEKYLHQLKKRELKNRYQEYYDTKTVRDREEEVELMEDFAFSDRELELFLKAEEVGA